ncbi:hypothetical protein GCM10011529_21090 [Polymorphobacter glacialis]|uniref:Uncharacterized protein n=1 Tax=Sandarakinorhabdus glacialis TaxID=1614636 RepID=A0A916ZU90_9SPHN|nr:hypothetical protein GCM10011529_21090 [Polymorphobacter glacialis]
MAGLLDFAEDEERPILGDLDADAGLADQVLFTQRGDDRRFEFPDRLAAGADKADQRDRDRAVVADGIAVVGGIEAEDGDADLVACAEAIGPGSGIGDGRQLGGERRLAEPEDKQECQ